MAKWWSKNTVAVVTGSNKGIGFATVRGLAKNGVTTIMTARDEGRGQKAADSLKAEGLESVIFHQLDVTSADSIDGLAKWLEEEYGGLDILINNAAISRATSNGPDANYQIAKAILDTNYYGVNNVSTKLLPLLRPGGRILTISSGLGQLENLKNSEIAKILDNEEEISEDVVDSYAAKYLQDVREGRWEEGGWATFYPDYSNSKVLLNSYTRCFAKTLSKRPNDQRIYVNVVCPGFVATDLNSHTGTLTTEAGADTPVWLALLPEEHYPHGGFWRERKPISFWKS